jgi:urease accessory protein
MTGCAQQPPWKVVRGFPSPDGSCLVHLQNISGGVLAGDRLDLQISLASGARAQVTTTGATRVYRARAGAPAACQSLHAEVAPGAIFEYLPDPIIPFAGSRYSQTSEFHLEAGAGLFTWEIIAPGRAGERFLYEQLDITTKIYSSGIPVAIERARLAPAQRPLEDAARLGGYSHAATFFICREGERAPAWAALEETLTVELQGGEAPDASWGVSTLVRDGIIVRGLAMESRHLQRGLLRAWRIAKLALYGVEPAPPRKIH